MPDEPDNLASPDVNVGRVLYVALGVLLLLAAGILISLGLYEWKAPKRSFVSPSAFPRPSVLETQEQEQQRLWITGPHPIEVSKEKPVIPIERAMEMIVQRGADGYAPIDQKTPAQSPPPMSATSASRPSAVTAEAPPRPSVKTPSPIRPKARVRRPAQRLQR